MNVGFRRRAEAGSPAQDFYAALDAGSAGYRRVARFRSPVVFPLSLEARFREVGDDPFSNLTKINPAIDVYVRD